jgi:hypothetical protein
MQENTENNELTETDEEELRDDFESMGNRELLRKWVGLHSTNRHLKLLLTQGKLPNGNAIDWVAALQLRNNYLMHVEEEILRRMEGDK